MSMYHRGVELTQEEIIRLETAGVDYDLAAAMQFNDQEFKLVDIKKVHAYHEGERDSSDNYEWIVELLDGRVAYLVGWQDYTGWDCQSGLDATFANSPRQAVGLAVNKEELLKQVNSNKPETWYEQTNKELKVRK